jgi:hypothetical protein
VLYSFCVDEIDHSPGQFFNSLGSMLQMPGTHMPDNELWPGSYGPHFPLLSLWQFSFPFWHFLGG